jgi:hypothetical protein
MKLEILAASFIGLQRQAVVVRISGGIGVVENAVRPRGSTWWRRDGGDIQAESIEVFPPCHSADRRPDIQVNGAYELVSGNPEVTGADREASAELAGDFKAGLFGVGLSQIAIYGSSALGVQRIAIGRILLAGLLDGELEAFLNRSEPKALTPKTVTNKTVLAEIIRRIRADGFALTDEELELGLRSIAVPIRTRQNRIVAAINVGVHAARVLATEMVHRFLPQLSESAQSLSQLLG